MIARSFHFIISGFYMVLGPQNSSNVYALVSLTPPSPEIVHLIKKVSRGLL